MEANQLGSAIGIFVTGVVFMVDYFQSNDIINKVVIKRNEVSND